MLDTGFTQGTGLQALAQKTAARVVAMASQDDRQSEWPLLCGLCGTWIELGYPVIVLDATQPEGDHTPGLLQMLENSSHTGIADRSESLWPIYPAQLGLSTLGHKADAASADSAVQQLGALFHNYAIVLVYARTQALATTLADSGLSPLLTVSNKGNAVLTTYQSLKQLLMLGHMEPTIVALTSENEGAGGGEMGPYKHLQTCAMDFLGHQVTPLRIATGEVNGQASVDMKRLALRLLESATTSPKTPGRTLNSAAQPGSQLQIARSF